MQGGLAAGNPVKSLVLKFKTKGWLLEEQPLFGEGHSLVPFGPSTDCTMEGTLLFSKNIDLKC